MSTPSLEEENKLLADMNNLLIGKNAKLTEELITWQNEVIRLNGLLRLANTERQA